MDVGHFPLEEKNLELRGNWEFYWNELLDPEEQKPEKLQYSLAGNHWTSLKEKGRSLPSFGYATYRLTLVLPDLKEQIAISMPVMHTSYRLFVDGKLIHENGMVGTDEDHFRPSYKIKICPLERTGKTVRIQVQIANYVHTIAGMKELIRVGTIPNIYGSYMSSVVLNWVVTIFLFMLSLYHIWIYIVRKTEIASLYLGLLYICVVFITLSLSEPRNLYGSLPDSWCIALIRMSKLILPFILYFGSAVIYHLFYYKRETVVFRVVTVYCAVYAFAVILSPNRYVAKVSEPFEMVVSVFLFIGIIYIIRAVIEGKKDSLLYLTSFALTSIAGVHDLLYFQNTIPGIRPIGAYGLFLFFIPQSIILTRSFITLFRREEEVSRAVLRSNEDLERKVKERTFELEKANRWKSNFISLLSHDLRSPLIGVSQILEIIQYNFDSMGNPEKQKFLDLCRSGIQNSLRMIKQLLDVSRFDSEGIRLQPALFYLEELLDDVIRTIESVATVKEIDIRLKMNQNPVLVGDRILLEEVLKNIIINAIKYSYSGSKVDVIQTIDGNWISIQVIDYGVGMDSNQLDQITRDETPKSQHGTKGELGTGLGLKLSQTILEAHFGKLKISSNLAKGSKFEILLSNITRSILLADDSDQFRSDLAEELRRKKWVVLEAKNGEEALDHLTRITPNLIVTDKHMPVMDGISFVHEWEAIKEDKKIPIIMLSSDAPFFNDRKFLEEEGLENAVLFYLSKLYSKKDLVEKILAFTLWDQ
ncbi:hybrid sensor histidine kinase/response regulator [Leptospira ilyithenensis]|uniref:histidine kinase n=1 Tax=Leptospira ilyithenensis TaxID=2484901 RepID=A0A4R9LQB5_9LEPT|nr:ATP-binding protein [Leptospira ilyithenensis]TGN09815.1 response regulator [Leptospira ilyithenensis]